MGNNSKMIWIFINNLGELWFGMPQILQFSSFEDFSQWSERRDEIDITIRAVYYDPDCPY